MIESYDDLITKLKTLYPNFDITMGSTNVLTAPTIIIQLSDVTVSHADNGSYMVVSAEYIITWYVESTAQFDARPAAETFGNLSQVAFDQVAKGEMFQAGTEIIGPHCLWDFIPGDNNG